MTNPWLEISLDEYESHMRAPDVAQAGVLRDLFAAALASCTPRSVAVLGVAGGNGLEAVPPDRVRRVVGIDVNSHYLEATRARFSSIATLELHCIDLANESVAIEPVDLVHAALIFEHAGTTRCLENALSLLAKGGCLSVVLQLPGEPANASGASVASSLTKKLGSHFLFIDRETFVSGLESRGYILTSQHTRALPQGKAFWHGLFKYNAGSPADPW